MIHIYTGNGKGKTSAAVGMAIRCAGAGMNVRFFQFLKDGSSGEITMLEKCGIITETADCSKFVFSMSPQERSEISEIHNNILKKTAEIITEKTADMVVLDEFFGAYEEALLDKELAERIIFSCKETEIILTGRNSPKTFIDKADYVTVMESPKHPYYKGIPARKGIEF